MKHFNDKAILDRIKVSSFRDKFQDNLFAQNWYAAFCNNDFMVDGDSNITYSTTWRGSGANVASIRTDLFGYTGDYLDWYCSGITARSEIMDKPLDPVTKYVEEGTITSEIFSCLKEIGLKPNVPKYIEFGPKVTGS